MPTIAAVTTAFHPDERLTAVVEAALKSCTRVVVVDNTPGDGPFLSDTLRDRHGVTVLRDGRNRGLAGALNAGVDELTSPEPPDLILFLDQDSVLGEDLVTGLAEHLTDPTVGIAAPAPWDEEQGRYYEPGTANGPDIAERDVVITSGMLVRRNVLTEVGPFRSEFFVDHVDNDFCLRVRTAGYRVLRDKRHKLPHSLGQRNQHKLAGLSVASSRHPTWRLYWIARNGTVLIKEHRKDAPVWSRNTALYLAWWFALRTAIEAPRGPRAMAMLRGFRDGARGRTSQRYLPPGAEI
ncbi:glycosyltransferase [Catenulispora rubra]|uniref:glycosyltransferase n=1 Tax=Catenulispora rubra TaxID=280293 RepID=UPI001892133F|nr:glycosyltransferase [Catenulispora rubra]